MSVFLNNFKAFDTINRNNGIIGIALEWLRNYLTDRMPL
jgi:hypothetical protein